MDQVTVNSMLWGTLCDAEALRPFFMDETSTQSEKEFLLKEAFEWCICHDICSGPTKSFVTVDCNAVTAALNKRGIMVQPGFFMDTPIDDFIDVSIDELVKMYNTWRAEQ